MPRPYARTRRAALTRVKASRLQRR